MAAIDQPLTLTDRVQALPNEISDAILDLVLIPDDPHPHVNSRSYKPPVQLQIDHHSREKLAATYYRKVAFIAGSERWYRSDDFPFDWMKALPQHHRKIIKQMRFERTFYVQPSVAHLNCGHRATMLLWTLQMELAIAGLDIELQSVSCNFMDNQVAGIEEEKWLVHGVPWNGRYWIE